MAIPLDFKLRLQLNIRIYPNEAITLMQDVTDTYFPAIWFEASGAVTEEVAGGLKQLLELPTIMTFSGLGTLVLCMFGLLFSVASYCHKRKHQNSKSSSNFEKVQTKEFDEVSYYLQHDKTRSMVTFGGQEIGSWIKLIDVVFISSIKVWHGQEQGRLLSFLSFTLGHILHSTW